MSQSSLYGWDADAKVWRKVLVNAAGKLIIDPTEIFEDPPTENEAGKAPQSAWAFDHEANASAHHTKFTITEHDVTARHPLANLDPLVCSEAEADSKIATHAAIAAAHHARYTDAEAMRSFCNNKLVLTAGTFTSQSVAGKGMLVLESEYGNIFLKGLDGGVEGQMIFCMKPISANSVTVYNNSGDAATGDKILTTTGADQVIAAASLRHFWLIYYGSCWRVDSNISI